MSGSETLISTSHVLDGFRHRLGPLWADVAPHCVDSAADDLPRLESQIRRCSRPECARHPALARELEAMLAGWYHYGPPERMVLRGAVDYLAASDKAVPTVGLMRDDGDLVVSAAVRALLRGA